ncbi:MAG TPA: hypothetical protein VIJ16_01550 [Gemmatimonadaceae bacterium]
MALLLALVVLAVAASFLVAGFYAARNSVTADRLLFRTAQLSADNDLAAVALLAAWDSARAFGQAIGATNSVSIANPDSRTVSRAWTTRFASRAYWVTLQSNDAADSSTFSRSIIILRVAGPEFPPDGGLIVDGDVRADGLLEIVAADSALAAVCGGASADWSPLIVPLGYSAPAFAASKAVAGQTSTYTNFGEMSLPQLTDAAALELPAGAVLSAPTAPIIHARGDLELTGGSGRGVLLVDGQLLLSGPVSFHGVIESLGGLKVTSSGVLLAGMVLVGGGAAPAMSVKSSAGMKLQYDPCLIEEVSWHAGSIRPLSPWGWAPAP